jgi:hypothetical protein
MRLIRTSLLAMLWVRPVAQRDPQALTLGPGLELPLARVPAGAFRMGSDPRRGWPDPPHRILGTRTRRRSAGELWSTPPGVWAPGYWRFVAWHFQCQASARAIPTGVVAPTYWRRDAWLWQTYTPSLLGRSLETRGVSCAWDGSRNPLLQPEGAQASGTLALPA